MVLNCAFYSVIGYSALLNLATLLAKCSVQFAALLVHFGQAMTIFKITVYPQLSNILC